MEGINSYFDPTESNRQKLEVWGVIFIEIVTRRDFSEFITT
jgi:hypothetical protein